MLLSPSQSSDSDQTRYLADRLESQLGKLSQRIPVVARPTHQPPPAGAWAPGELSIQLPMSGSIELSTPHAPELRRISKRHMLIVCPGSWSPRTRTTTRNHLAIGLGIPLSIQEFKTPAHTTGTIVASTTHIPTTGPLKVVLDAATQCAGTHADPRILHGLVLALLPALASALSQPHDDLIANLETHLRCVCHLALSRDAVAAHLGVSSDHLNRCLRKQRGLTFITLLQKLRIERACADLRDPSRSLDTIAAANGFGSASYLIRIFRRHMGCTPQQWRRHRALGPS